MKTITTLFASVLAAFGGSGATTTAPVSVPEHCVNISRPLFLGSTGPDVALLQEFLGVKATGFFGPMTQKALTQWQISTGVVTSAQSSSAGLVGPKTRAALHCKGISMQATTTIHTVLPTIDIRPPVGSSSVPTSLIAPQAPVPPVAPTAPNTPRGGGSAATGQCAAFTAPQPPASQCSSTWVKIQDEAGCDVEWSCDDPNAPLI